MIPLFPLVGAALMLLAGKRMGRSSVNAICVGAMAWAFAFSAGAVWQLARAPGRTHEAVQFTWIAGLDGFHMDWGYLLDPLSAVMILVVTGIGLLIHIYS